MYPNMKEFRVAMKQFAINEEFELHLVKTDKKRYIANCNADGCPWHINGRTQPDKTTVKVYNYLLTLCHHFCCCKYLIFLLLACCRLQL